MEYFTEVNNRTGGNSKKLNISLSNAADNLADFIAHRILEKIDEKMAENMKEVYEERKRLSYSIYIKYIYEQI